MRLAVLVLLSSALSPAQEVTGSISGVVKDSLGASIPGAQVSVTHSATGAVRTAKTNEEGLYHFAALAIGAYDLTASHEGFKRARRTGLELHIGDHLAADLTLEVGEVSQEVTVTAEAATVDTETSAQGGLISGDQVRELQLNGRSFMTLLELLPGVASDMPDRADPNTNPLLYVNGGRNTSASFNIDGGSNSDSIVGSGSLNTFTSVDTIAEVKVLTSTFAAEFGRGGFAQVNVVTRGGTQKVRGSLFYFHRNDKLDARDYFSHEILPLKLNNFGYTFSGPLSLFGYNRSRKKTFFFWTQEFNLLSTRAEAVTTTVPTLDERNGIFTGRNVVDPDAANAPFPNGLIPASRKDANAVKLINLFPLPNFRGPGAINFVSAAASQQTWREELIRIDHNFTPLWKIYGRFVQDSADITNPYGGSSVTSIGTRFPGISRTAATRPGKNLTVNMTNIFSQSALNEMSFTYAGREITQNPTSDGASRERLGIQIPELFPENDGNIIPTITLGSGYAVLNVSRVWLKQYYNLEFSNNFTKTRGRHTFKMGGIYSHGGNRENPTAPNTNGSFTFTTNFTRNPVSNLLLGLPNTYLEAERFVVSHSRFSMAESFFQDDLRATSRLTLNIGIRHSNYFNPYDVNNVLSNFLPSAYDPSKAQRIDPVSGRPIRGTGDPLIGIITAGNNSPFGNRVTNNNKNLWGPRAGMALRIGRGSVIRTGYGMFFTRPLIGTFINNAFDNPPFSRSVTIQTPRFSNPGEGQEAAANVVNLTALGNPMKTPKVHSFNFTIQHALGKSLLLDVGYVGTRGRNVMRPFNINTPPAGLARQRGVHINFVRPFPGYGNITERQTTAWYKYDSLQISLKRQLTRSKKLSFGLAYTWSKGIDNGSSERGGSDVPPNSYNPEAERGVSDYDRKHILTTNFLYWLPRFTHNRPLGAVLNGWQLSGITRMWSGRPFDVVLSADVAEIGATQNQRPNVIADARGPRTTEQWFNTLAFARPETGTFGNMGRNSLRYPGVNKWDLAIFKNFTLGERSRTAQFRAEMFNAFNHPSFTTVGNSLNTTTTGVNPTLNSFGVVTGTRDARVVQFALKLNF